MLEPKIPMEPHTTNSLKPWTGKPANAPWNLLVVDDEVGIGESLRLILSSMGYRVTYVDNGEEGIQLMAAQPFDLIITDLVMDGVNGYDILDYINQNQRNLPVIMLTGLDSVEAAVRALKLGAYDYILKPFELDAFRKSIGRALEKRQLEMTQYLQEQRIEAITSIAKAATSTLKLEEIFKILHDQTREFVHFDNAALFILNEEEMLVDLIAAAVDGQMTAGLKEKLPLEHPLIADLFQGQRKAVLKETAVIRSWVKAFPLLEGLVSYALIPLVNKDRLVGGLFFGSHRPDHFSGQDLEFLVPIADQISVAIDNARLLELELRRSRQLELINHIGRQLTFALSVDKLLEKTLALLKAHFQFQQVDLYQRFENSYLVRFPATEARASVDEAIIQQAVQTGQTVLVQNTLPSSPAGDSTVAQLAIPLKSESEILGVLNILDSPSRIFSEVETAVIEAVAVQVSLAWKNAQLFEQTTRAKNYLELILASAEDTAILTFDHAGQIVTFNTGAEKILGITAQKAAGMPVGSLLQNNQVQEVLDAMLLRRSLNSWESEINILRPDQKSVWVNIHIRPIEPSTGLHMGFLAIMIDITARIDLNQKLTQLTVTDDLTGLYNQRFFFEQLNREIERAERRNAPLALCIFDLDKFKQWNDTFGHLAGDEILSSIGGIVANTIRTKIDSAFRYGGDEFILLLPETNILQAATLMERLRASLHQKLEGRITISGGIAEYTAGLTDRELIDSADKLLYIAKRKGGNQVIFEGHSPPLLSEP